MSCAISRARVGEYVSNYEQAIPQLHDQLGNLYSKPQQVLCTPNSLENNSSCSAPP